MPAPNLFAYFLSSLAARKKTSKTRSPRCPKAAMLMAAFWLLSGFQAVQSSRSFKILSSFSCKIFAKKGKILLWSRNVVNFHFLDFLARARVKVACRSSDSELQSFSSCELTQFEAVHRINRVTKTKKNIKLLTMIKDALDPKMKSCRPPSR